MAVIQYKTAPRCKFCQSPHRAEIDAILEKRAKGGTDPSGLKINQERALAMIGELGVENPTADNIKSHWGRDETKAHSYFVSDAEAAADSEKKAAVEAAEIARRRSLIEQLLPGWLDEPRPLTPDEVATISQTLGLHDAIWKFVQGEKSGFTVDHGLKGGDLATKRNVNDATAKLLQYAGIAIGQSIQTGLQKGTLKELGPVEHEVVEAEFQEHAPDCGRRDAHAAPEECAVD